MDNDLIYILYFIIIVKIIFVIIEYIEKRIDKKKIKEEYSEIIKEEEELKSKNEGNKSYQRLGKIFNIEGIDNERIVFFSKLCRLTGFVFLILFLSYELYLSSSFYYDGGLMYKFIDNFSFSRKAKNLLYWLLFFGISIIGFLYRFYIGCFIYIIIFKIYDLLKLIFKKI